MKRFYLLIFVVTLFSFQTVFAVSVNISDCEIVSTLRIGSKGAEVRCLQGKVGVTADGSFGPLTKNAVKAFQSSKGLVADGIVGPLSRKALIATLANNNNYPAGCVSTIGYSPTTGAKCDGNSNLVASNPTTDNPDPVVNSDKKPESINIDNNTNTENPNLTKLDQFITTVVEVGKKNGKTEQELDVVVSNLKQTIINSDIDYYEKFKELLVNESKLSINSKKNSVLSFFNKAVSKTFSFLGVNPSVAHAGGLPLGGALIFPFFCACNGSWMITISPLPPTFTVLQSYYPGTQGFASYNMPFNRWLKGFYVPSGICMIPSYPYCIEIPTEGTITPMVGSSPI